MAKASIATCRRMRVGEKHDYWKYCGTGNAYAHW